MTIKNFFNALVICGTCSVLLACAPGNDQGADENVVLPATKTAKKVPVDKKPALLDHARSRLDIYATFPLTASLDHLSANQKKMIPVLIEASKIMDELFWLQAFGEPQPLLDSISDPQTRNFAAINYGPWDRLDADRPFLAGFSAKPAGARFYPEDMSKAEYEASPLAAHSGLYSLVVRDETGALKAVPYHVAYAPQLKKAADLLSSASELAEDPEFANYLRLRAEALTTDQYQPSDMAWMDMKNNKIDLVIGAIETYEDQLFNYRTSYESYVLIKDLAWSERLSRYASFLPELQRGLPVPEKYKSETPGSDSDLNAYDAIYYAGHSNAGSKTIAINLPNDEEVQLAKGTRRLQLKNAMRAKFDKILVPIAAELIVPEQRKHITFDGFFGNTMFHEVAHGLGIKNTLDGDKVRIALQELASPTEEGKADVLGLYMVTRLFEKGEIPEGEVMDNYVTFLAGIFRSIRFGASSAHGKANMVRFNFFREMGAFNRNAQGQYAVDFDRMQEAMNALSQKLLVLQGDGDYAGTKALIDTMGQVSETLQADLERLSAAGIPVDIVFDQGVQNLKL
ncbi:MAG: Zn-dependent hydrolase [Gammaproteobacteria bacterium]|nr:Zn-dependent hydrolase [Gammaproteobacteria bacterium]